MTDHERLTRIPELLLAWYDRCAREMPWRSDPQPYRVWVSEIMLQQTRVETVRPYFLRFVEALPHVAALADCPEDALLKLWEGLGYYSRVRNLQKAARLVMERHGGLLPASFEELRKLPGIGDYTAGAIASIAFQLPFPAVDGNVLRVISRVVAGDGDIADLGIKAEMSREIQSILPVRVGDFNQSLMELGACVCLPNGEPLCGDCPLAALCLAKAGNLQDQLPVKTPKKPRKAQTLTVLLLRQGNRVALSRRPATGLLAGMWQLPNAPGHLTPQEVKAWLAAKGLTTQEPTPLPAAKHIFTHVEWAMTGWDCQVTGEGGLCWVTPEELTRDYALPTAFRAYFQLI